MAICPQRRADASPSEAHGGQAVQMCHLREIVCAQRSFGASHETPLTEEQISYRTEVSQQQLVRENQRQNVWKTQPA